jgi:xanthine/CO dehydrogenase XdhC/CoxF family maturation factor
MSLLLIRVPLGRPAGRAVLFWEDDELGAEGGVGIGHLLHRRAAYARRAGAAEGAIDVQSRERFPEADEVHAAEYETLFPQLAVTSSSYLVIVTRGHRDDLRVLRLALATPARYIAMIGSRRKVPLVRQSRLLVRDDGSTQGTIGRGAAGGGGAGPGSRRDPAATGSRGSLPARNSRRKVRKAVR